MYSSNSEDSSYNSKENEYDDWYEEGKEDNGKKMNGQKYRKNH